MFTSTSKGFYIKRPNALIHPIKVGELFFLGFIVCPCRKKVGRIYYWHKISPTLKKLA
jgi:hypothetical protein